MRVEIRTRRGASSTAMHALALCIALMLTQVLIPFSAHGQTIDRNAETTLVVHKFEQPELLRPSADGLPKDTSGLVPVPGASFTAKRVPGIDLHTNEGQRSAAGLGVTEAAQRVSSEPIAAQAVTNGNGTAVLSNLKVGLYYVQETSIQPGFAGTSPFLVALPLTNPQDHSSWLTTVHVYPKNARAGITLEVIDQDAVGLGDTVQWTSRSGIPLRSTIDGYRVQQIINPQLELLGSASDKTAQVKVSITGVGVSALILGQDYHINYTSGDRTITVDFLESGLRKLEAAVAADPSAEVQIEYGTTVLSDGVHANTSVLYPSREAIDSQIGVNSTAETRWGPLSVVVHENDKPDNRIPGASFQLYRSPEDAAARRDPIIIEGVSEWITDEQGRLIIEGLRFSNFANGLDRELTDPLYRTYWVVPTNSPPGWEWVDADPLGGAVNSEVTFQTLIYEVIREDDPTRPGILLPIIFFPFDWFNGGSSSGSADGGPGPNPDASSSEPGSPQEFDNKDSRTGLASTGAQVTGLITFALVLIAAGVLLIMRRRGNQNE
ncbi:SpaH/EbpB family LPXTG-anchored major pilin [Corynebacterium gallinarum]|uniref:SpaH/EbpB family LPXTG-anchored major pilin n=1 Tax=Corynebacterium gallinarum TaxID=2762214 RepID=A0A8I0HPV2_9CORY|nr:SpaH/EbpB family LPXTG-anchored major pilin [Corynebacterium gallinarum]MBD8029993.1 SpaH/EbpB family LPXTG-anchored major pilin [Corynebacterium gallinarum]